MEKTRIGKGERSTLKGIEWFIEDQALWRSYDSAPRPPPCQYPPPLPSASCLSFSVFLCVAGRAYSTYGMGGRRRGAKSYRVRPRESLTNNTLLINPVPLPPPSPPPVLHPEKTVNLWPFVNIWRTLSNLLPPPTYRSRLISKPQRLATCNSHFGKINN